MSVTNWVVRNYEADSRLRRTTARYVSMTVAWFAAAALSLVPLLVGYVALLGAGVTVGDVLFTVVWLALTLVLFDRFYARVRQRAQQHEAERPPSGRS